MHGYTCQERWVQCSIHPLSVVCACGYCRYYHCARKQSVDACSHPIVVKVTGLMCVHRHLFKIHMRLFGEFKARCKVYSKKKLYSTKGQILSFFIIFAQFLWHSQALEVHSNSVYIKNTFHGLYSRPSWINRPVNQQMLHILLPTSQAVSCSDLWGRNTRHQNKSEPHKLIKTLV